MSGDLTTILLNALRMDDPQIRTQAEAQIKAAEEGSIENYIGSLIQELGNESKPPEARQLAGVLLKNTMASRDPEARAKLEARWLQVRAETREQVKQLTIQILSSADRHARQTAAAVAAAIARVELPHKSWVDFIPQLCNVAVETNTSVEQREAALSCIGYICEDVGHEYLAEDSGKIITVVVAGLSPENPKTIREEAAKSLLSVLIFMDDAMSVKAQRDHLFRTLCTSASIGGEQDADVRNHAMRCLVKTAALYYDRLAEYVQALLELTSQAIMKDEREVSLQAIEFWITICETEYDLHDAIARNEQPEFQNMAYAAGAARFLIPQFWTHCLLKQEEDADEDDFIPTFAAGTCIQKLSPVIDDSIVGIVMPFVTHGIQQKEWRQVEAATLLFGSILEGRDPEGPIKEHLTGQVVPFLLQQMSYEHPIIKDTTAWCLGRIAEFHPQRALEHGDAILKTMEIALKDPLPRNAKKACYPIHFLAVACKATDYMAPYYKSLVQSLLCTADRPDAGTNALRIIALETMNAIIENCTPNDGESIGFVKELLNNLLQRLSHCMNAKLPDKDALLAQLCASLGICVKTINRHLGDQSDAVVAALLQIIKNPSSTIQDEALLSLGAVAHHSNVGFTRYLEAVVPALLECLKDVRVTKVYYNAVGLLRDILPNVGNDISPFCPDIFQALLHGIGNPELDPDVKCEIIAAFGDIALQIQSNFTLYMQKVVEMIIAVEEAASREFAAHPTDPNAEQYLSYLQQHICECYAGILLGLKSQSSDVAKGIMMHVLEILCKVLQNYNKAPASVLVEALNLLADAINVWKREFLERTMQHVPAVLQVPDGLLQHEDPSIREAAQRVYTEKTKFVGQ
eukprot:TRINITY_DN7791_c3_g2_i1.p1 TRINITY_DN7791_c3_g2~~TRINITY_DN7791_c3_g2_i1.p1  ORF type:complete len:860 (+),score=178.62 TRINITY_DN7791_c3_g2_i1:105-2684(+)